MKVLFHYICLVNHSYIFQLHQYKHTVFHCVRELLRWVQQVEQNWTRSGRTGEERVSSSSQVHSDAELSLSYLILEKKEAIFYPCYRKCLPRSQYSRGNFNSQIASLQQEIFSVSFNSLGTYANQSRLLAHTTFAWSC